MEFSILPYDRLPDFIRENEKLRQAMLQNGGIMKYVAEHIDDPYDDDTPQLFVQYQNYVAQSYRKANRWNPNRQSWTAEDMRKRALNDDNHLWPELQSRKYLMQTLRNLTDIPHEVTTMVDILGMDYLTYAWKENLRLRRPDIDTDLGTYKYVMQQFDRYGGSALGTIGIPGLACQSIDIALKIRHGGLLTEMDIYDSLKIDLFHHHFFGPTITDRLKRGIGELLHDKRIGECREEAMKMLYGVKWFSQHIYNDDAADMLDESFTLEDRQWLRSIIEHYDRDRSNDELNFFYFGKLFAEIGRLWDKQLRCCAGIELSELEKKVNSFVNTEPAVRQITWEDKKQCFKDALISVMEDKYLFKRNTQWIAVYRFAIDNSIMYNTNDPKEPEDTSTPQYAVFEKFAHELKFDSNPPTRIPFTKSAIDSIKKPNYKCYNTRYPWSKDGLMKKNLESQWLYHDMEDVYNALKEEYDKRISQAIKVAD